MTKARRYLGLLGLAALVLLVAVTKITSYDTWYHLSLGRWIAEHRAIPRANLLSHTMPERPTVDHQWLFQLGLYGLWRVGGPAGAILAKAAVVAAAFAIVAATARRKGAQPLLAAAVVLVAAFAARSRFTLRPQVVGFALFAVYLHLLERWRDGHWRGLYALMPLQVLWANVHGSAVVGLALPLAYTAGEILRRLIAQSGRAVRPAPRPGAEFARLAGVAVILVPATVVNPNGLDVLSAPFALSWAQRASGLKELLFDRSSLPWGDLTGRHAFFAVLALAGFITLVGSARRRDATEAGLFLGLLAAALHSQRFVGLFAVGAASIIARNTSDLAAPLWRATARRRVLVPGAVAALVVVMGLGPWVTREQRMGLGPAEGLFPEQEAAFVQEHYPTGKLFNEFEHGGYIAWRTRRPVFLDSRGLLAYDAALLRSYIAAWTSHEAWAELMERHDLAVALVARPPLEHHFHTDPRWLLTLEGPVCRVFVRRPAAPDPHARPQTDAGP